MSFTLTITFSNTGGTQATGVGAALTFGGYTYLTPNAPALVILNAGGTSTQAFTIAVGALATSATVTMSAMWSGTEAISTRAINGGPNTQTVVIQAQANVAISSMVISGANGVGPYVGGMNFTLTITYSNIGGTTANNVNATLTFGGYAFLAQVNNPAPVSIFATSTNTQAFTISAAAAATSATVTISATWTGTESISNDPLNGGPNTQTVVIQSQANVQLTTIVDTTNNAPYMTGNVFVVTVTFNNLGEAPATVDAVLTFGGYSFLVSDNPGSVLVAGLGSQTQVFTVSVQAGAPSAAVIISATWRGNEVGTNRPISGSVLPSGTETVAITNEVLQIFRVSGARAFTGINNGTGVNTTVALGATFLVTVGVRNLNSIPVTIDQIEITFWFAAGVVQGGFTYSALVSPGIIAGSSSQLFNIPVQAIAGVFVGPFNYRFAVTALVNYSSGVIADTAITEPVYSYRDSIVVVNSFLSVAFNSANPGLSIDVASGADVPVVIRYTITSTCWETISLAFTNVAFSDLAYVVGGSVQVPANGSVSIPAFGSRVVWLNFTVDASAVTMTDTLDFSFDVVNDVATKGLSQASAPTQTFTLSSLVVVTSWRVDVTRVNGTLVLNTSTAIGFFDSFRLNVSASAPNLDIYMTIVASGDATHSVTLFWPMTQTAPAQYSMSYAMSSMGRSDPLASQNGWLNISLVYRLTGTDFPLDEFGNVLYFIPAPLGLTALNVAGVNINLASTPFAADVEATLVSLVRASFTNAWTHAASVQVLLAAKDPASMGSADVLYQISMTFSAGTWNWQVSSSTPAIGALWHAGRSPGLVYVYFNVTDTYGNQYSSSEIPLMSCAVLRVVDHVAPAVDISSIEDLARQILDPASSYELHVIVPVPTGESFVRSVVMYLSSTQPSGNSLTAWQNVAGVSTIRFSLISADTGEWMAVLQPQAAGSTLHWAFYALDYSGNDNAAGLTAGSLDLVYAAAPPTAAIEEPIGYALLGVMAFGLVFAISYRVQQGVQSVKKAKKVSAAVKKAAPGKTIGGTSSTKSPISKDIPTKSCPICKAKIGADLSECPYCHRKF